MTRTNHQYLQVSGKHDTPRIIPSVPSRTLARRVTLAILALIPTIGILAALLVLSLFGLKFNDTNQPFGCDPNGDVWVSPGKPDLWSKNYGLAITLGFGEFLFSAVKSIDIAWDLVVGRGAQVLGAWLVYKVFRGPVVAIMRYRAVPYDTVVKMEYNTTSVSALMTYMRDVHWRRQYFLALMMVLSTLYVLVLPTWLSAMSGYQPIDVPLLKLEGGNFIAFTDLNITATNFESNQNAVYYKGRSLSAAYLTANGMCAPQKTYRWGFSLTLLFMFLSVTCLLSIVMYAVWVRHFWNSHERPGELDKIFGSLRTTLAVAGSIRQELGEAPAEVMSNGELILQLKTRGGGMRAVERGVKDNVENLHSPYGQQDIQLLRPRSYDSRMSSFTEAPSIQRGRAHSETSFL